jgi:L-iditol 2-dehydrogenase
LGTDPQLDPAFRPGRVGPARFPRTLGYEKVGEVIATGDAVTSVSKGQRVICRSGHEEECVLGEDRVIAVPDGITDDEAVTCSLGTVAVHAARRARLQVGDDVFIAGQGFVGLLQTMIVLAAGANRLVVTDPYEQRRKLAVKLGADEALDPAEDDVAETLTGHYGPGGFDVAFETSASAGSEAGRR